ncbi:cytochrome c-type biogenesis protein CcmH [Rouxiella silvae]|uniref:Cytochrome c-type biogenesis protein n=1 Tax=Rouxiella silvae TaxID=1646373 RepID=A0AA40X1Y9_9GAMM|nr:cytochrome c-type biogenesis protein [Rouxiella silvae]KQN47044.1 cytochrome C [Serratia sp. Leaf50]MBF6636662.1 cytochrome c-type biogenesis protein CcmH [Rouxiella silvae]ORJ21162.1 cytochrome c-type biogenesis protein CcmH [Rouxiella silvae]
MRLLSIFLGLALSFSVFAAIDTYQFKSVQQEQQYRQLTEQLRCPKCQNTNIAASDSIIAADMRTKVYQLLNEGQSSKQIVDYMVARYGNFVTYEPPVTPSTLILWVGPALFVLVGALVIILRARRRQTGEKFSSQEQQRLAQLLGESDRKES